MRIREVYSTMLGDMESNDRRNVFAHNESQLVIDYLSKHYSNLSFLNHCFVKTLFQGLLCVYIRDGGYSVESVNWPAAILDSQCRWTLGESLTHSQSDDRRSLNLDIEGLVSNKMHRLCRRDLEGAVPLYNCYYDERFEESKHWHVRLKTERPCGLGMS